jgi:hypothetical protein
MSDPFFITGLPRSRTAWLANLFTTEWTLCFHDRIGEFIDDTGAVLDFAKFQESFHVPGGILGDSDSGLMPYIQAIDEAFPTSRWAVIERPFEEAMESLKRVCAAGPWAGAFRYSDEAVKVMSDQWDRGRQMLRARGALFVPFCTLSDIGVLCKLSGHLLPGMPFNRNRAKLLRRLKIEAVAELHPMARIRP